MDKNVKIPCRIQFAGQPLQLDLERTQVIVGHHQLEGGQGRMQPPHADVRLMQSFWPARDLQQLGIVGCVSQADSGDSLECLRGAHLGRNSRARDTSRFKGGPVRSAKR